MRASWKVDEVHRIVSRYSPERLASWRALEERPITGAGVDAASGQVVFVEDDAALPGPPPILLSRAYCSGFSHRQSVLGRGWALSVAASVHREPGGFVLTDSDGRELLFEHEGEAKSGLTLAHPLDRTTLVVLGPNMFRVDDRDGNRSVYEGDGKRPASLRSIEVGTETIWIEHDEAGRPVNVRAGAHAFELVYSGDRLRLLRLAFAGGEVIEVARYEYDQNNDLAKVRLSHDVERRYAYSSGLLVSRVRPDGGAAYYGYDDTGSAARCIRSWSDGDYDDRSFRYKRGGTTIGDGTGATWVVQHDALYRPLVLPRGRIVYDPISLAAIKFEGPADRRAAVLDGVKRPVELRENGSVVKFEYDAKGRVIARTDAAGGRTEVRYSGDEVVERGEDGARTMVRRNERGATEIVVGEEWLEIQRDGGRRPTRLALRDEVWTAKYDALGRPSELAGPEGTRTFEHDGLGRLSQMGVNGVRAGFEWDGERRLIRARMPEGDWVIERDKGGMPRSVVRPDLALELVFDRERRLTELRDRRGRRWRFVRDRTGRVIEEHDFDGRVHGYSYAGITMNVESVVFPDKRELRVKRDAGGRVLEAKLGTALMERFGYDGAGRLISATRNDLEVTLTRDKRGAVTNEKCGPDEVGARTDARGRRAFVVSSLGARIARTWGANGERMLEVIAPDGSRHEVRLDAGTISAGRLRAPRAPDRPPVAVAGVGEIERDKSGRIIGWKGPDDRRFVYAYGPDGLLEKVTLPTGDVWRYSYDAFGRRIAAKSHQWDARWVWDGGVALHELTSYAPPTLYVFDPADGAPIGKVQNGASRWLGLYQDFVCLFDPNQPDQPTTEYWPWRGGLQIDFPTGLWLGPARVFHPRAAEPMGTSSIIDELFGPADRRPFDYRPRIAASLERPSDATLSFFVERLTTPAWLDLPRTLPTPWPQPLEHPRVVPLPLMS
jgi:YD repeat-containing protein